MLMTVQSGLSRAQVKQKHFARVHSGQTLRVTFPLRQLITLSLGLALITDTMFGQAWLGLVPAVVVVAFGLFTQHVFTQWQRHLDEDHTVLVVRDGLRRAVKQSQLVEGDVIEVKAGTVLPVDVETNVAAAATGWLKFILNLTGSRCPAGMVPAGSQLLDDAQVSVLATGSDRFALQLTASVFAGQRLLPVWTLLLMAGQVALAQVKAVSRRLTGAHFNQFKVMTSWLLPTVTQVIPAFVDRPLVAKRLAAKETAFRYNQDPVTSPSLDAR